MSTKNNTETKTTTIKVAEENITQTKDSRDIEIASLKDQIKSLMDLVSTLSTSSAKPVEKQTKATDVTLVYMSDSDGVILSGDLELICTRFGESFTVSRGQFDAIVGKYRKWFDDGILAVSPEDITIAAAKGLKTSDEYYLTTDKLVRIGKMSANELEKLWDSVETPSQRLTIVQYYKRKFMEGIEPGFQDRAKIELLNRLTNGGLKREATEISGESLKILPTEM